MLEEILTTIFEIPAEKARDICAKGKLTEQTFSHYFSTLENILGFDSAAQIVREGRFLEYSNSMMDRYLQLAREAYGRLSGIVNEKTTSFFYSLESLHQCLAPPRTALVIDPAKLRLSHYSLLHVDNDMARDYLDTIITQGDLIIGNHEHWRKSKSEKGPRGLNIIKKIAYQIHILFSHLDLGRPDFTLTFSQNKLSLAEETRRQLAQIRDIAYHTQSQKSSKEE